MSEPAGIVMPFAGSVAPQGYLFCDGSAVSRTDYADLFTAIGTTYGVGDGSTTFNVPDLSGRVVIGVSGTHALGTTGGEASHVLLEAELPAHAHSIPAHNHTNTIAATTPALSHNITAQPAFKYNKPNSRSTRTDYTTACYNSTNTQTVTVTNVAITAHAASNCTVTGGAQANAASTSTSTGGGLGHNNMQPYLSISYIISTGG